MFVFESNNVVFNLFEVYFSMLDSQSNFKRGRLKPMGVARIFQWGGHTLSNSGYSRFRNLNIVGCLSKKRLTKGGGGRGSRAPQHPPSYALD